VQCNASDLVDKMLYFVLKSQLKLASLAQSV